MDAMEGFSVVIVTAMTLFHLWGEGKGIIINKGE